MRISDWSSDVCSSDLTVPAIKSGRAASENAWSRHRAAGVADRIERIRKTRKEIAEFIGGSGHDPVAQFEEAAQHAAAGADIDLFTGRRQDLAIRTDEGQFDRRVDSQIGRAHV